VKTLCSPLRFLNNRQCLPLGVNEGVNISIRIQSSPDGGQVNSSGQASKPYGQTPVVKNRPLGTTYVRFLFKSEIWSDKMSKFKLSTFKVDVTELPYPNLVNEKHNSKFSPDIGEIKPQGPI
jgi:hypothetical protein